jgi:polysaccharide pyruvyl transferase WcaK-like protein
MLKKYDSYIVGYYGMKNTGDDVLLYTTQWACTHLLSDNNNAISCAPSAENPEFNHKPSLTDSKFRGHQRLMHYRNALLSKKTLFGGGSVLHSERDIQLKRHMISLSGRQFSRCVGVGIGPFESVGAERACAKFLNECGFVGVRDPHSYEIAQALSPHANVQLTFDLAPLMLCHEVNKVVPVERKGIMFNFCQQAIDPKGTLNKNDEKKRLTEAVNAIAEVWRQTKEPIYLVDFNGHDHFGDFHIHQQIMARVPSYIPISHIEYDPNPFRVLQRIAGFKAVVSMRLHGSILGFLTDTPVISINYHSKCYNWCSQVGVPEQYQLDAQHICAEKLANQLYTGIGTGFSLPTMTVEESIQSAKSNWRE